MQGLQTILRSNFDVLSREFFLKRMKNRLSENFLKTNATTDHHRVTIRALAEVPLATDCVTCLAERCERNLLRLKVRLNRDDLLAIGA